MVNEKQAARPAGLSGVLGLVKRYSFVLVFLAILIVYAVANGGLTLNAGMNVLRHSAVIGTIAIGMGIVCLTGEIDLSVGSMLALVAGFSVVVFNATNSIPLTLVFALAFGAACGLVNGFLVGVVKMPAFIVTLATMLIYRSVAQYACQHLPKELIGNGSSVYRMSSELSSYDPLYAFGNARVAGVPIVGLVMVLMVVLFVYVCTSTKFGKKIYAVGSNARAAHLAGIGVPLMKTLVFTIAGALVGLSAFLWVAMNASADPATTGSSYEMYAIASVVLGGISMSGGRGRMIGVLFGALSYDVIDKIIIALKMDALIQDTIKGVILIVVIMIQVAGPQLKEFFGRRRGTAGKQ
ncbi:ABC transporter permease [Thermophilibacter sp.]